MTEPRPSQVLGGLPRSRPHRRSQRRPAISPIAQSAPPQAAMPEESTGEPELPTRKTEIPGTGSETRSAEPKAGTDAAKPKTRSAGPKDGPGAWATGTDVLGTAVQAAAELAEIGVTFWTRTLRDAASRLPRP